MRVSTSNHGWTVAALAMAVVMTSACGEVARTGRSPAYLVIDVLEGSSGAVPGEFATTVSSDVVTLVSQDINGQRVKVPTIYTDLGRVALRVGLKNPGTAGQVSAPSPLSDITVQRYRVVYRRADGRNTQGVDVPYAFDGAFTITVPASGTASGTFDLVRSAAKAEAPLATLRGNGGAQFIGTIAEVTLYGRDQAGNDVSVTGTISVSFADFGDPA